MGLTRQGNTFLALKFDHSLRFDNSTTEPPQVVGNNTIYKTKYDCDVYRRPVIALCIRSVILLCEGTLIVFCSGTLIVLCIGTVLEIVLCFGTVLEIVLFIGLVFELCLTL